MSLVTSLAENITSLPSDLSDNIWSFLLTLEQQVVRTSEESGLESYNLRSNSQDRALGEIPYLYEEWSYNSSRVIYPKIQLLSERSKAVVVSQVFVKSFIRNYDGIFIPTKRVKDTYHWIVYRWPGVNYWGEVQRRYDHFFQVNQNNPYLLGSQHIHGFIRGTKLLIISGTNKGKHGVVVGHQTTFSFHITPTLFILLADESITSESQDNIKLLDLHGYLPFAVPFDPDNLVRNWHWGRSPFYFSGVVTNRFWGDEAIDPIDTQAYWRQRIDFNQYTPLSRRW